MSSEMIGPVTRHWALAALCLLVEAARPATGLAADPIGKGVSSSDHADFQFALLRAGGTPSPRQRGLARLAWEVRKRTSIQCALEVAAVDPTSHDIFDYPLLVWQGDQGFPPLTVEAVHRLEQHLRMGGTLWVDIADAQLQGPFHQGVERELRRMFPQQDLVRVPTDHVLYESFYLVDRHGGRVPAQPFVHGMFLEDRLAVVITFNDLAGAMARDDFGQWEFDVGPGGDAAREASFRFGVNLVMYALCLDYKEDQVHIPFILRRRR